MCNVNCQKPHALKPWGFGDSVICYNDNKAYDKEITSQRCHGRLTGYFLECALCGGERKDELYAERL